VYRTANSKRGSNSVDTVSSKAKQEHNAVHNMLSEALQCTSQDSLSLHTSHMTGELFNLKCCFSLYAVTALLPYEHRAVAL
jgi:hypothetical protein